MRRIAYRTRSDLERHAPGQGVWFRTRLVRWAAIASLGALAAALPSRAADLSITEKTYSVSGGDVASLRASLDAARPTDREGTGRDGLTNWDVRWRSSLQPRAGACVVSAVEVTGVVEVVLPEWRNAADAIQPLRVRWQRFEDALREHEQGHVRIAEAAVAQIRSQVAALSSAPSCEALDREIKKRATAVLEAARAGERDYDRTTRHGETQGAVFP